MNTHKQVLAEEKPRIKITDENELTVSYASDNTPSQCNVTDSGHSSTSGSLKRNESNSIYRQSPKFNNKRHKYCNKMTRKNSNHSTVRVESSLKNITETIDLREEADDKRCLVKRIIHLMTYGIFVTLLQIIGVIGAYGLFGHQYHEIIFWFSYQTIYRSKIL
ncbi:unnamed protein product [Oppiella nova]|uniref:Uncharacterized protein n=1 Tax=Oppiella nova TaxID=334625 RepID=A0A7R9QNZ5_9ACAR|nr:unnamed protein product [Oppiella nova]CAG2170257.1 unnamed protein product [Oppiella nova]